MPSTNGRPMDTDRQADLERLLAECDALPDDPEAQAIARALRKSATAEPDTPFAARMRGLISDYAFAIHEGDHRRQCETAKAIRLAIASALVPSSDASH